MIKFVTQYKTTEETLSTDTKKDLHVGFRPLVFLGPPVDLGIYSETHGSFNATVFFISFSLFCLHVCSFVFFSMQWFFCLWLVLKLTQPLHLVRYKIQTTRSLSFLKLVANLLNLLSMAIGFLIYIFFVTWLDQAVCNFSIIMIVVFVLLCFSSSRQALKDSFLKLPL